MHTHHVDTVVVGAGHAGLAVSRLLTEAGRDHVVLERGVIAERWRSERWASLHLLTPNWMNRLPGWDHDEGDPHGYLPATQFRRSLTRYAASFGAPVLEGTTVLSLQRGRSGRHLLHTTRDTWHARHVVLATGPHATPVIPEALSRSDLPVIPSSRYRSPASLPRGGVLVVGASASGAQIADELARTGREVVLSVGRHTRMPRRYRGRDVFWWLERTGRLARTIDQMPDPESARAEPSLQLVGRNDAGPDTRDLDLATLHRRGVRLVGRLVGMEGRRARFADDLAASVDRAEATMHRFLDGVDRHVLRSGLDGEVLPAVRPRPFRPAAGPSALDLRAVGIRSIVVAAGFRPDFSWLDLPVLDARGRLIQHRGVTAAPGLYVVGQRFQHRRDSGFVGGAGHGARDVVAHLSTGVLPTAPSSSEEVAA